MILKTDKVNKILLAVITVLLVILVGVIYWQKVGFKKSYWAVYLISGDLYFGELKYFPKLSLKDAYLLQRNADNQQNPYRFMKFSDAFWGPKNRIYLNDDNILWKVKLRNDSQIVSFIEESAAKTSSQNQNAQSSAELIPAQSTSTANIK